MSVNSGTENALRIDGDMRTEILRLLSHLLDPAIIGALLAGGVGKSIVDAALREALARARLLAIQADVDPNELPNDPTKNE